MPNGHPSDQLTWSLEGPPANPSPRRDIDEDSLTRAVNWSGPFSTWWAAFGRPGSSGKMCAGSAVSLADVCSGKSCAGWGTLGMGGATACWTGNISGWPSDARTCSFSAIVETGDHLRRYFVSPRAAQGILRRARSKSIPDWQRAILSEVAYRNEAMKP